jgi:uncharacterized protein (DUF3820 family)
MSDIKEYTESILEKQRLFFGKYKNVPLEDIPKSYFDWLRTTEMWNKLGKTLKKAIGKTHPSEKTIKDSITLYKKLNENKNI